MTAGATPHMTTWRESGAVFDAEYGPSLSNHLPMTLAALHRLGADDARLSAFARAYSERLQTMPPAAPWPGGEPWAGRLGDPAAWPAYRSLFAEWLGQEVVPDVLVPVLPVLMRGCGAAAFHGLIRTAWALDGGPGLDLADALAYWACRWFSLGEPAGRPHTDDPAEVVKRLHWVRATPPLIAERMAMAASQPGFLCSAGGLRVDLQDTLPRLATLAAERYAAGGDFTVLHLVTSAHAVRVLLPWLDDDDARLAALHHYAVAFFAGVAASPHAGLTAAGRAPAGLPWPALVAAALASDDEHVIKLVDSCREHETAYGRAGPWRAAATRAIGGA